MKTMSNLDRVLTAIRREEPDRVPTFEIDISRNVIEGIKPGISYEDFIEEILKGAIQRYRARPPYYHLQSSLAPL